jgi:hypothetical protein
MKWLKENMCPWDERTFSESARNDSLDSIKWLLDNECPCDGRTYHNAILHGNLCFLSLLKENH